MNKSKYIQKGNSQKGQVLLFVVVAMTIALALAVGVSLQTVTTISDVADTDTAQRSLAAAEGGAENFLTLSNFELTEWINDSAGSRSTLCSNLGGSLETATECRFEFAPISGDNIGSLADVSVRQYKATHEGDLRFNADLGNVKEINVKDYTGNIKICWDDKSNAVGIYYILLRADGAFLKNIVEPFEGIAGGSWDAGDTEEASNGASSDYDSCYQITPSIAGNQGRKLRIYAIDNNTAPPGRVDMAIIVPSGQELPVQGFEIVSRGTLTTPSLIQVQKVVRVYRSNPYLPGLFDFAIYSEGPIATPTT